jgi:hypothetical protein
MYEMIGLFAVFAAAMGTSYVMLAAILKGIDILDPRPI